MDLSKIQVFEMLTSRMQWLSARQAVLAQNVANADTPDYKAKELKQLDFRQTLARSQGRLAMAGTSDNHMRALPASAPALPLQDPQQDVEMIPTENSVILEEEMMKAAKNAADYQMITNLYQKHIGLLRTAIVGNK